MDTTTSKRKLEPKENTIVNQQRQLPLKKRKTEAVGETPTSSTPQESKSSIRDTLLKWIQGEVILSTQEQAQLVAYQEFAAILEKLVNNKPSFGLGPYRSSTNVQKASLQPTVLQRALGMAILKKTAGVLLYERANAAFTERFIHLIAFRMHAGHYKVSKAHHPVLGKWVENLRHQGLAQPCQRQALDAIQFNWSARQDKWNAQFAALVQYKEQYGTCMVPKRWHDNPSLGSWVCQQRGLRKKLRKGMREGNLDMLKPLQEKIDRLNKIGFVWSAR